MPLVDSKNHSLQIIVALALVILVFETIIANYDEIFAKAVLLLARVPSNADSFSLILP